MPNWPSIEAFVDGVMSQTFGEPVVYQPVQAGAAQGSPFTVTAVRHLRVREESGAMANFEEISVNPSDFCESAGKRRLGDRLGRAVRGDDGAPARCLRHAQPGTSSDGS